MWGELPPDWRRNIRDAKRSPGVGIETPGGKFYITNDALGHGGLSNSSNSEGNPFIVLNIRGDFARRVLLLSGNKVNVMTIGRFFRFSLLSRTMLESAMTRKSLDMLKNVKIDHALIDVGFPYWKKVPGEYARLLILRRPGIYRKKQLTVTV